MLFVIMPSQDDSTPKRRTTMPANSCTNRIVSRTESTIESVTAIDLSETASIRTAMTITADAVSRALLTREWDGVMTC